MFLNAPLAMLTTLALFLPVLGAAVAPWLVSRMGHHASWLLTLSLLLPFAIFLGHMPDISAGMVAQGGFVWAPGLGLDYAWRLDGLSLSFTLLISGIGTLIVLYAGAYLKGHEGQGRFLCFILVFSAAMLGLVASDNVLMLFVYWELTSITSFLLIGFDHDRAAARRGALQALVITGGGGLALLAGLLVASNAAGTTSLSAIIASGELVRADPYVAAGLILILAGAFTKSAQFPFHVWLPNAMEAPTPVSAFLHSATMVKAGVYLLMRLYPLYGELDLWQTLLPLFGGVTLVAGALLALAQTDLKLMLAYTTVASLGLLVMLTGIGSERAVEAAVLYLFAHALFKGALFMIAGVIDHETGTRDVTRLGGLCGRMPVTFAAALLAAASMGGLPLLAGFMAKEEIYAALTDGGFRRLALGAAIVGNALMFAVGFTIALRPFIGKLVETPHRAHDGPLGLMAGPVVLALKGLAVALVPMMLHATITNPMTSAITAHPAAVTITAIPHLGVAFTLSLVTIALGAIIWLVTPRLRVFIRTILDGIGWGPDRGFDQFVSLLVRISHWLATRLQSGRLDIYLAATFVTIAASLLVPLALFDELPKWPEWPRLEVGEASFMLIAVLGLGAVLIARSRLTAVVSLGVQGFAVAILYLLFGAPDLAFTQFMVETLSVIILALILTRLRLATDNRRPPRLLVGHALIALACGIGFALMLMAATQGPVNGELTAFFSQYSKLVAHGANVVNVIIVDFRGTDTLGEIAVVIITGLAILALIRLRAAVPSNVQNDPDSEEARP